MTRRATMLGGVAVLGIAGIAVGVLVVHGPSRTGASARALTSGAACVPGPDVVCYPDVELLDTRGEIWTPGVLAGKVVVANYWATWCKPCVEEIPLLTERQREHPDELVVLGLLTEPVADDELEAFVARHGIDYPIVRVDAETAAAFGQPRGLPTTHVYDRSGHRRDSHLGPLTAKELDVWLDEFLRLSK